MRKLFVHGLCKGLPALLIAFALTACGPEQSQSGSAVVTDALTISPSSMSLAVPADTAVPPSATPCASNPGSLPQFPVLIIVKDDQGRPLGNADINVILDFAPGTSQFALANTFLFDGNLTTPVADPYSTTTDDDGTKLLYVGLFAAPGCAYAGALTVISGPLFQQMAFDVTTQ